VLGKPGWRLYRPITLAPLECSAADQVHNFEAIAPRDECRSPLPARNNFKIALNGKPIRRQAQLHDELRDVKPLRHFTRFAIHLDGHRFAHLSNDLPIWALGFQLVTQFLAAFADMSAYDQGGQGGLVEGGKRKLQ
jgi:hypothetical protein